MPSSAPVSPRAWATRSGSRPVTTTRAPFGGEQASGLEPDAGGRAGDEADAVGEPKLHGGHDSASRAPGARSFRHGAARLPAQSAYHA